MADDAVRFRPELIADSVFLAEGVQIRGDVTIAERSSVWFNSVIRGDTERVAIGEDTNVQDLAMLHADPGFPCLIGDRVTIGHRAIVHGAEVASEAMIGMGAIILNGARVGEFSIIAAGAVVTEGMQVPAGSMVMGVPAKIRGELSDEQRARISAAAKHYVARARQFQRLVQGG